MKLPAALLTLALLVVPGTPAMAATTPVLVALYTFDAGPTVAGKVAENSGHGLPLTVRSASGGTVRFLGSKGHYLGFPARCEPGAKVCPRALLEAASYAGLNPGTRSFRWSASVYLTSAQIAGSSNVMQKGVATGSQWKMQIGSTHGKAQCVVVGLGVSRAYIARSTVTVADAKWHSVVCERTGRMLSVWIDRVKRGQVEVPATLSITNTRPLRIGGPNFNTTSDMYHGYLDNVSAALL
jgi:hypothetical protein